VTPRDLRYLLLQCCLGSALVNVVINGGLGWATTRSLVSLPLWPSLPSFWRSPGIAADVVGTAFGVTFGTCLGMAFQIRRDLKSGKIAPVRPGPGVALLLARFPYGTLRRSVGLGVVSVPLFAVPMVLVLLVLGVGAMERTPFIVLKACFAALEAAIVTPFIALAALGDIERALATK
jgi:hypothetical protein